MLAIRINSNDPEGEPVYVQMVTALVFQLIQCVVQLPLERDAEEEHKKKVVTCLTNPFNNHILDSTLNVQNCVLRWIKMFSS